MTIAGKCLIVTLLLTGTAARANDGGIAFGGSPRLLGGHKSVAMQSEIVHMTITENRVTVDCRFVFQNSGPACVVRMGFPDRGRGADDPDEEYSPEEAKKKPAKTTFTTFKSWVDGKSVKTELIRADKPGDFWHAKTVTFPANGKRIVRDVYTVNTGGQVVEKGYVHQTYYVLHTGSSWRGTIGRSEIVAEFRLSKLSGPLRPRALVGEPYAEKNLPNRVENIVYRGPSTPTVSKNTLRFVRTNWRPAYKDDVLLYFGYKPFGR